MSKSVARKISDYPFVEIAREIQHIEVTAGLHQVTTNEVSSFSFHHQAIEKLIERKYKTLHNLADNRFLLLSLLPSLRDASSKAAVLTALAMVRATEEQIKIVTEHIERANRLQQYHQEPFKVIAYSPEVNSDELLF